MRSFFNWLATGFAAFFAIPTFLILISWNALPGDSLYGLKTSLEDIALFLTRRTALASTLSVKYTDRRFSEANLLLSKKGSTIGYQLLVNEAQQSRDIIVERRDSRKAQELVAKIENYQKEIELKQTAIQTGGVKVPVAQKESPPVAQEPSTTQTTPTQTQTPSPPTKAPEPAPQPVGVKTPKPTPVVATQAESKEKVIEDLENTKKELEVLKEEIKKELPPQASEKAQEIQEEHEKEREDRNRGRGRRNNREDEEFEHEDD